jgi:large subunit ribosomal protein L17
MSNSDNFTNQKESGGLIKILFIRASKDNHDALVKIGKQTDIFYRKHGVSKYVYKLNARENMMDFVNLSKTISANDNEDVWLEILAYRDAMHVEEVMKAMEGDKGANELYKEAMELITPGSIVFGDFSRLKEMNLN